MLIGHNRTLSPDAGIKVLGERNSGTNVLETLLREHVDVYLHENIPILSPNMTPAPPDGPFPKGDRGQAAHEAMIDHMHHAQLPDNGGWKHAAPDHRFTHDFLAHKSPGVLIIVRHPASWLRSMHKNPFHALVAIPRDFGTFIRQPWLTVARDSLGPRLFPSLPDMLAAKMEAYADLLTRYDNSCLLRYEDLVQEPDRTLRAIGLAPGHPVTDALPDHDIRGFLSRQRAFRPFAKAENFRKRAAAASYEGLASRDRAFLLERLSDSILLQLYPP